MGYPAGGYWATDFRMIAERAAQTGTPATTVFVGVVERASDIDPAVYFGPDATTVNRLVAAHVLTMQPQEFDDAPDFLTTQATPDLNDAKAVAVWLTALREATTWPWYTLYAVPAGGGQGVPVTSPHGLRYPL